MRYICQYCGKEFGRSGKRIPKHCSRKCKSLGSGSHYDECQICGKKFWVSGKRRARYCSRKCKGIASRKINKICPICKRKFGGFQKNRNKHCSQKCMGIARQSGINKKCEWCNKPFYVPQSRKNAQFCSIQCQKDWQGRNKTKHVCKICGKEFTWSLSRTKHGNPTFCSAQCQGRKIGTIGTSFMVICRICGQEFKSCKSRHNPTYCSIECRNKDKEWIKNACIQGNLIQQKKKGLNKLEKRGRQTLIDLGLELNQDFEEQVLIANKFLVDIFIPRSNLIIQWDGDYWHCHPRYENPDERQLRRKRIDKSQNAYFNKCGYKLLRFWESDFKNNQEMIYENIQRAI